MNIALWALITSVLRNKYIHYCLIAVLLFGIGYLSGTQRTKKVLIKREVKEVIRYIQRNQRTRKKYEKINPKTLKEKEAILSGEIPQ